MKKLCRVLKFSFLVFFFLILAINTVPATDLLKQNDADLLNMNNSSIIPRLIRIEESQKNFISNTTTRFEAVDKRFEDIIRAMTQGFEAVNKRFEAVDKRFEDIIRAMTQGFEAVDKRFEAVDKRFEAVDKRFEDANKRFEDIIRAMTQGFETVDKRFGDIGNRFKDFNNRFEDLNNRFEDLNNRFEDLDKRFDHVQHQITNLNSIYITTVVGFITMFASLFGFAVWDRKTNITAAKETARLEVEEVRKKDGVASNNTFEIVQKILQVMQKMSEQRPEMRSLMQTANLL
ncbi:conserved hypothetical protein, membrane [Candidatus Magnetomorum sp. HK-1]|nr:conserved hypothetical protein, membrane [Candidatus Magnetomorum sp. HK-1]